MRALAALLFLCSSVPARATVAYSFDKRVELLSVIERLARPVPEDVTPYAEAARRHFGSFAGHPAVVRLRAIPESERAALTEAFLGKGESSFIKDAEEFGRAADFDGFWGNTTAERGGIDKAVWYEGFRGRDTDMVSRYLRMPDDAVHRFVIAPLLPRAMAANLPRLRVRTPSRGKKDPWELSEFGSDVSHEIAHDLLDPLAEARAAELDADSSRMFAGCTSSWRGCVMEQVVVAVTLRSYAKAKGERRARPLAREYGAKYRDVPALCERLREWEARGGDFAAFYPRLLEVLSGSSRAAAPAPPRRRPRP